MYFYEPDLAAMRQPQSPAFGEALGPAGEHLGDVLAGLGDYKQRLDHYLRAIVPESLSVERVFVGQDVSVELRTRPGNGEVVARFGAGEMSDGTVRAAGLLAALFQPWIQTNRIRLVAVEEPETAVHPAAAGVLFDAMQEASERVQVLATTQSPDLLDRDDVDPGIVRVFGMRDGVTTVGVVDGASQEIVRANLATIGQLLRSNQLSPGRDR